MKEHWSCFEVSATHQWPWHYFGDETRKNVTSLFNEAVGTKTVEKGKK